MARLERRQNPRMAVEGLAYVNLEPDNGGIILNISEGGLCFQSSIPVQHPTAIRFWFAQRRSRSNGQVGRRNDTNSTSRSSQFIVSESELSWTDEKRKIGGLRFTNMTVEAREQIRAFLREQCTPVDIEAMSSPPLRLPLKSMHTSPALLDVNSERQDTSALTRQSFYKALPEGFRGFSGGLVSGVIVSAIVVSGFMLATHRAELGNSLIQLGERVGGKVALPVLVPEKPQSVSLDALIAAPAAISAPQSETVVSAPPAVTAKARALQIENPKPSVAVSSVASTPFLAAPDNDSRLASANTPLVSTLLLPPPSPAAISPEPVDHLAVTRPAIAPRMESENKPTLTLDRSKEIDSRSSSEKYLEVGKFSDRTWTNKTTERLSQLGFHATVVQRGALWKKSFSVLVGPYSNDGEVELAHQNLTSRGFAPRSFERGTRELRLPPGLKLNGTFIPSGDCVIHWESYMPDAFVKFEDDRGGAVTVEGKWITRDGRHDQDVVVYQKNSDGSRTLLELRFYGRRQVLVFGKEGS